jgi:protein-tyrosine phosphatase
MSDLILPHAPFSIVATWPTVIAIGGVKAYGEDLSRFQFVMNVAFEFTDKLVREGPLPPEKLANGQQVHHARLNDTDDEREFVTMLPEVHRAVDLVHQALARGENVLVTCAQGRNRSALVVAETLIGQFRLSSTGVIDAIQERRAASLQNPLFVKWLRRRSAARRGA